ncbi:MAG: ribonuclease [Frankiales bacterium]|nr:ribonuclease [Frankiales bacterium]
MNAPASYALLETALGTPLEPALLERALTHRSYAYEHGGLPTNERLEFLGDAVLGLVVTDALYRNNPDLPEGQLAKLRAGVVNTRALADVARRLDLGRWLRLGRGEDTTGGRDKTTILADTMEALIGAVYVEHGIDGATTLVRALFDPLMAAASQHDGALDWKTALQELGAARGLGVPSYALEETGPDHAKHFTAEVALAGQVRGAGAGRSKKEAEQVAAQAACAVLRADDPEQAVPGVDAGDQGVLGRDDPGQLVPGEGVPG